MVNRNEINYKTKWVIEHNLKNNNEYENYVFLGNYMAIFKPTHHRAHKSGYVYIHQLQAEKKLGRNLKDEECVHHIDLNKFNNEEDNLIIFKTTADHSAFHQGNEIKPDNEDLNIWVSIGSTDLICPICGNSKLKNSNMCIKCMYKERKKNIPDKVTLFNLLLNNSFVYVGKKYGVTDNAVRKWCDFYKLPRHSKYYRHLKQLS